MIIEFVEVSEGRFNATNIVNEYNAYIDRDMLGEYFASYEKKDLSEADECGFATFEEAAQWLDRFGPFVMETSFGN